MRKHWQIGSLRLSGRSTRRSEGDRIQMHEQGAERYQNPCHEDQSQPRRPGKCRTDEQEFAREYAERGQPRM